MSYLPDLRDSLVAAADRQAGLATARRQPPRIAAAVAVAVAVTVTLVIAAVALTQLRSTTPVVDHNRMPAARHATAVASLRSALGVLRRRQVPSDVHNRVVHRYLTQPEPPFFVEGPPIDGLVRRVPVAWGAVYLIPLAVPTLTQLRHGTPPLSRSAAERHLRTASPGLAIVDGNGGSVCCSTASQILGSGELSEDGGTSAPHRSWWAHLVLVVPDGVARVRFVVRLGFPTRGPRRPPRSVSRTVAVHDNVAAVFLASACCARVGLVWYAPDGHILKRIAYPN